MNIRKPPYEPRFKYICDEKKFNSQSFKDDIAKLPFNIIYSFDDPNEKLELFTKLLLDCLNEHAPLQKRKFTRPPAPWMQNAKIRTLQKERNDLRYQFGIH